MKEEIKGTEETAKEEISLAGLKEELRVVSQNLGNALDEISICRERNNAQGGRMDKLEVRTIELDYDNKQLSDTLESLGDGYAHEHMARMQSARAPMNPWGIAPTQPMPGGQIPYGPCFSHPVHPHGVGDMSSLLAEIGKHVDHCGQLRDHKALAINICDAIVRAVRDTYDAAIPVAMLVHDIKRVTDRHLNIRD